MKWLNVSEIYGNIGTFSLFLNIFDKIKKKKRNCTSCAFDGANLISEISTKKSTSLALFITDKRQTLLIVLRLLMGRP